MYLTVTITVNDIASTVTFTLCAMSNLLIVSKSYKLILVKIVFLIAFFLL